ncbi:MULTISPECIES: hypothetical protein [Bradyrhizobium]|uniref:CopG family transcriptional regulator n=1 Tax=Bradyrhizobium ottawaense TaxID=931866 RepID=A0ABV4FP66_9BRAD|nr:MULTISPECIES: hypothetical protein [Bradyrhizobium]MBR1292885.1 hypothetical protein [Bradyrhizobium ottawaense]WLB46001.1 hypothetical protein QIH93_36940 [Bradyrhizobium ottawaense]WQN83283.1 hypothetical protein U7859_02040 [Bradyrhizobium ottawaense]BBO01992.1 hypothetical protein SG09_13420 [Bradyrhizobium ottawaense]GMO49505.1 hypothetical protein BwSF21_69760 [Bradyrhizobium ottawaense]
MSAATTDPISLRLPPNLQAGVDACAAARALSPAEAVEYLVREALLTGKWLTVDQRLQLEAEAATMAVVDVIVTRIKDEDAWGDDVTRTVFVELRDKHRAEYDAAIANGEAARVNRDIGKRVRRLLDADVVIENGGYRKMGQVPRSADELIKTYTVLRRRGVAEPAAAPSS